MRRRLTFLGAGCAAFGAHLALGSAPGLVETVWGLRLGPGIAWALSRLTGPIPFAVGEVLILGLAARLLFLAVAGGGAVLRGRRRLSNLVASGLLVAAQLTGIVVALFYLLWGFQYSRPPLESRLGWPAQDPARTEELAELAAEMVAATNVAYAEVHGSSDAGEPTAIGDRSAVERALEEGWRRAARETGLDEPAASWRYGRVKRPLLLSRGMDWIGISGFFLPFTGEASVNRGIPDATYPHVAAHEKSHQRGLNPEDEANFFGFLAAAAAPHPMARYSAYLFAQRQILFALAPLDQSKVEELVRARVPGVQRDVDALVAYWRRFRGPLREAGRKTNDAFLKSNRVEGGVLSYGRSVELLVSWARHRTAQRVDRSPYSIGGFHREITTSQPEAQTWFDRGLALCIGFSHEEARRCFQRAVEADPDCPMAHWGIAYAFGPNINDPQMSDTAAVMAWESVTCALERKRRGSAVERALIDALRLRYAPPAPGGDSSFQRGLEAAQRGLAYAEALRDVAESHPDDPEVAALLAEALMLVRPWGYWKPDGTPQPETPEILRTLEAGLARWPDHPWLCHFYIHAVQASPEPEKALAAANRLRGAMPGVGHLLHMPSHVDVRVGDYAAAVEANRKAIEADSAYVELAGRDNDYTRSRVHNFHFIVYAAMFEARSELATSAAERLVQEIPAAMLARMADELEAFVPTPLHVLVRFGRWEEILDRQRPPQEQPLTRTVWRYARCLALASTGRTDDALREREAFREALTRVPETRRSFNNDARAVLGVAEAMMDGEIAYRAGRVDAAFVHLREAVRRDDALHFDEPWGWMQPARHALGALLLEQGRLSEAEAVYRRDLERHPGNAWSLHGLAECLARLGSEEEADAYRVQLRRAGARADVPIRASCYCRLDVLE